MKLQNSPAAIESQCCRKSEGSIGENLARYRTDTPRATVLGGFKLTEAGLIPDDWEAKRLKEISPRQSVGLVINPSTYFDPAGTVPMLVGSNVSENRIDWGRAKRITTESNQQLSASRLRASDIVMVRVGDPGVAAVIPNELDECNCASMMIVRGHHSFDSTWLCHAMNSPFGRRRVASVQYGTAQKQFNISDAVNFVYAVPPLAEQRAIAEALSDVDGLLGALDALIAKKRAIKQAAMQQLLTGKTRLPGCGKGWVTRRLGDLATVKRGASPRPIDSPIWFDQRGTTGWVRISDLTQSGMYLRETTQKLSPLGVQNSRKVPAGSLIMSICATVGRPIITTIDICIHDGFVVFEDIGLDLRFAYYLLSHIEPDWAKHGQTGSQMNLNTGLIDDAVVRVPSHEEQVAIAGALSDIDREIDHLELRRDKTRAIKQGMMQQLLTGRVRLVSPSAATIDGAT